MKKISTLFFIFLASFLILSIHSDVYAAGQHIEPVCTDAGHTLSNSPACESIDVNELGFQIPTLGDILTFAIRGFFVIAGIAALFYMLLGAFAWVTSGGDKDNVAAARDKIQAAIVGVILIVAVLAVIWTLEQVVFKKRICLGLSCPVTLPGLITTNTDALNCCVCVASSRNTYPDLINTFDTNAAIGGGIIDSCDQVDDDDSS